MSSSATTADAAPPAADEVETSLGKRILILVMVVLGSTLYATTLLIASTLLPQMQGTMSATQDEIAWAMTFNILATAVATPMTGWLAARFGRRETMIWSVLAFTLTTLMCGLADSLETLILWRVLQGALGAPVIPLSQTILLDTFPKRQQGLVTSIFGMAVVIGPVIGPTVGSMLSEIYSWRWAFYMIVPVGVISFVGLRLTLPYDRPTGRTSLDWTGFLSLSVAIACVQLVLSRGQRLDWFDSTEIQIEAFIAVVSFWIFLAHSLTAERPFLNLKLLLDRNYALGLVLVLIYGMLNFTPMVLLPPLLQQHAGFPDSLIGEVIAARGVGATLGFFLAIFVGRMDPRIGLIAGFTLQTLSGVWLMAIDLNVDMNTLMLNSLLQGQPGRGHRGLSPAAQHRLQLLHLDLRCRDRAGDQHQLQPHGRAGEPLQQGTGPALGDRRLGLRDRVRPCETVEGDQPTGGHARLHQRLRPLHGLLGDGDPADPADRPSGKKMTEARAIACAGALKIRNPSE